MSKLPEQSPTRHFVALDGLRGIAAFIVLALHALSPFDLGYLVPHAQLAVDFFFMLSGFVIGYAYEQRLLTSLSVEDFIKIRLIRLYPLLLLGTGFGFLIYCLKLVAEGRAQLYVKMVVAFVCSILMLPTNVIHDQGWGSIYPFNDPSWSLFFEILINILYALIISNLSGRVLGAILVLSCLVVFVQAYHLGGVAGGNTWGTLVGGLGRVVFPFFCGIFLFRWHSRTAAWAFSLPVFILLGLLVATLICPSGRFNWVYESTAVVFVFPAIVICGARAMPGSSLTVVFLFFGRLSYPLYILHYPLIRIFGYLERVVAVTDGWMLPFIDVEITCAILFAVVATKVFDEPVRASFTKRRRQRSLVPTR